VRHSHKTLCQSAGKGAKMRMVLGTWSWEMGNGNWDWEVGSRTLIEGSLLAAFCLRFLAGIKIARIALRTAHMSTVVAAFWGSMLLTFPLK